MKLLISMQIQSTDMNWDQCSSVKTFVLCNENGKLFRITKSLFFLRIIYSFEWLISAQYKLLSDILDIHDKNLHINFTLPSIPGGFMNLKTFVIKVLSNKDIIHFQKPCYWQSSTYARWLLLLRSGLHTWWLPSTEERELEFS